MKKIPKIFISYSWKPLENQKKVIEIAERLVKDGVDVVIDTWNLSEGQDKYLFMEQMVNNHEIDRVLLTCSKSYKEKANLKKGGVGSESMIISNEIYKNADQKKFIPIILEKDSTGEPYIPTFVNSRIFIDFSDDEFFEDEYEKLIRNFFKKPLYKKPKLGTPPIYINEKEEIKSKNQSKLRTIKNALINERKYTDNLIDDFFDKLLVELENEVINNFDFDVEIDEIILRKIEKLKTIKYDFIEVLKYVINYSSINKEQIHKFFEKVLGFLFLNQKEIFPIDTIGSMRNDHFYFIVYELYLTMSTVLIAKEKYEELGHILHSPYIVYSYNQNDYIQRSFVNFCSPAASLNHYRIKRLRINKPNLYAEIVKKRFDLVDIEFHEIQKTDALLHYISCINANQGRNSTVWLPFLSIYEFKKIPFLQKMKSQTHFNKIKTVLNINSIEELKEKYDYMDKTDIYDSINRQFFNLPYLDHIISAKEIGKIK